MILKIHIQSRDKWENLEKIEKNKEMQDGEWRSILTPCCARGEKTIGEAEKKLSLGIGFDQFAL